MNLTDGIVESNIRLGPHIHGPGDGPEIIMAERVVLADKMVQTEIAKLRLPEGSVVVVDPWIYGESLKEALQPLPVS